MKLDDDYDIVSKFKFKNSKTLKTRPMSKTELVLDEIWGIINSDQPDEAIMLSGYAQDEIQKVLKAYAKQKVKRYKDALKGIERCCDGNEPSHEQIWHIANDILKQD